MSAKTADEADQAHEKRRRRRALVALGLAALVVAAIRLRIADVPLERDEGEYAYFAQLLLQGVAPWAEAVTSTRVTPGAAAWLAAANPSSVPSGRNSPAAAPNVTTTPLSSPRMDRSAS